MFRHLILSAFVATVANAGPEFEDVAASRDLVFDNAYGSTFTFAPGQGPWNNPALLATMQRNMGNGLAVGDVDADGDLDVYMLGQLGHANRLFRNDIDTGAPGFTDITAASGLGDIGFGRVAQFADLDNDGLADLVLVNDSDLSGAHPASKIFRGIGGGAFADVTPGSGFEPVGLIKGGMAVVDFDADGLLDIFVTTWCGQGTTLECSYEGDCRLYRNLGDFQFEDITANVGLEFDSRDAFTPLFADFDNDGDPDLFIAVDHKSDLYFENQGGVFVDRTLQVGATHTGNDMGATVADFDHDGDLDIYCTNITDAADIFGTTQYNTLLSNRLVQTGSIQFIDLAVPLGVGDTYWGWGVDFVDIENDGDLDIFAVNGFDEFVRPAPSAVYETPAVLFQCLGVGQYQRETMSGAEVVADSRAMAAFDYDHDGDQDFVIANVNEPAMLLENRTAEIGAWLRVRFRGGCGVNRDGFGTRIWIDLPDQSRMFELVSSRSYLTGNAPEIHVGLGDAKVVPTIRVRWPNGRMQTLTDVAVNRIVTIAYPPREDLSGDGRVDSSDLAMILESWGAPDGAADVDGDGIVGFDDLNLVLDAWGDTCTAP